MKRLRGILSDCSGITLIELLVASTLMCVVMSMAVACLHPAAAAVQRMRQLGKERQILRTVLSELRMELEGSWDTIFSCDEGNAITFTNGFGETTTLSVSQCETHYGTDFFGGRYLGLLFSPPEGTESGTTISSLAITATLYRDEERTEPTTTQTLTVELRHEPIWE